MPIQADYELERCELAAVLASGVFNRAPNLVHILTYICGKYFDGSPNEIKEYNIAIEALGRPADFDQKRDSIVRVEAHRLRKRLREYYESDGAPHPVQIEIPPGQYAPRFIVKHVQLASAQPAAEFAPLKSPPQLPVVEIIPVEKEQLQLPVYPKIAAPRRNSWLTPAALALAAVLIGMVVAAWLGPRKTVPVLPAIQSLREAPAVATGEEIRILAGVLNGRGKYVDASSHTWTPDRYFSGGSVFQSADAHPIAGTRDSQIYQSRREGTFNYDIPLSRGVYELHLYFGETLYGDNNIAGGGETSRIFQVLANGRSLLKDFDVIVDVGASAADVKVFKDISPANDGKLHLKFEAGTNPAFLNGIEIVPGIGGKIKPVRLVTRDRGFTDQSGRFWDPDRYVKGGLLVVRNQPVSGTTDSDLYRGERFGNLLYTIPVAQPGRYGLKLYFAERWFGPGNPGGGGQQSRIFDVLLNGLALRRNFDIYKEAGGPNRALVLSFHDLEPNPQGKLAISLTPDRNYASINALEVVDESK